MYQSINSLSLFLHPYIPTPPTSAPSLAPVIDAYSHYVVGVFVGALVVAAVAVCQAGGRHFGEQWCPVGVLSIWSGLCSDVIGQCATTVRTVEYPSATIGRRSRFDYFRSSEIS